MGKVTVDNIVVTPLKRISTLGGDILHIMKESSPGYLRFGEAYFSQIKYLSVKAWKRHHKMTLNLVVPLGDVRFVFIDELNSYREELIGDSNYVRLTIPPGIWFGFQGVSEQTSLILNIADIEHSPDEVQRESQYNFNFDWKEKL